MKIDASKISVKSQQFRYQNVACCISSFSLHVFLHRKELVAFSNQPFRLLLSHLCYCLQLLSILKNLAYFCHFPCCFVAFLRPNILCHLLQASSSKIRNTTCHRGIFRCNSWHVIMSSLEDVGSFANAWKFDF